VGRQGDFGCEEPSETFLAMAFLDKVPLSLGVARHSQPPNLKIVAPITAKFDPKPQRVHPRIFEGAWGGRVTSGAGNPLRHSSPWPFLTRFPPPPPMHPGKCNSSALSSTSNLNTGALNPNS